MNSELRIYFETKTGKTEWENSKQKEIVIPHGLTINLEGDSEIALAVIDSLRNLCKEKGWNLT